MPLILNLCPTLTKQTSTTYLKRPPLGHILGSPHRFPQSVPITQLLSYQSRLLLSSWQTTHFFLW